MSRCGVGRADAYGARQWDLRAAAGAVTGVQGQEVWDLHAELLHKKQAPVASQRGCAVEFFQRTLKGLS